MNQLFISQLSPDINQITHTFDIAKHTRSTFIKAVEYTESQCI